MREMQYPDQVRGRQGGTVGVRREAGAGLEGALKLRRQDAKILHRRAGTPTGQQLAGRHDRHGGPARGVLASTSARVSSR